MHCYPTTVQISSSTFSILYLPGEGRVFPGSPRWLRPVPRPPAASDLKTKQTWTLHNGIASTITTPIGHPTLPVLVLPGPILTSAGSSLPLPCTLHGWVVLGFPLLVRVRSIDLSEREPSNLNFTGSSSQGCCRYPPTLRDPSLS